MAKVHVLDRSGTERSFEAQAGLSLMENLRDNGFDDIIALCGGLLACATCQVYLDAPSFEKVGDGDEAECDLLDGSGVRETTSRLSCQIEVTEELDGLRLTIAPEK